jgi:hypothetical protein
MNTFGNIKSKIEKASVEMYGKPHFKTFMSQFKKMVLENKDLSELYYIYDDLSTNKNLPSDIADDYINESIEYAQILIENNDETISKTNNWINNIVKKNNNDYKDIDVMIYNNNIKNLESVLESKRKIKSTLTESVKEVKKPTTNFNVPLTSMLKIANSTLNNHFATLSEQEKKELNSIVSLSSSEIKKEMDLLKKEAISKLKSNLNESKDVELNNAVNNTIKKIQESKYDHYNLYKLKNLNAGL